jgi:hypothetical protein
MARTETVQIPANNAAGYVIVNKEDVDTDAVKKWRKEVPKATLADADDGGGDGDDEPPQPTRSQLLKTRKADLIAMAEEKGLTVVPDEVTVENLVDLILAE